MRALSIHQPWAVAILLGSKNVENRRWRPKTALRPGERFAIHVSAARPSVEAINTVLELHPELGPWVHNRALAGHVVGAVRYDGYVTESDSPWFTGPFGWKLSCAQWLPDPVPARGSLGLWHWPDGAQLFGRTLVGAAA